MNFLGSIVCKIRGAHKWTRKKGAAMKRCARCDAVAPVKSRNVAPTRDDSGDTQYEGKT